MIEAKGGMKKRGQMGSIKCMEVQKDSLNRWRSKDGRLKILDEKLTFV